MYTVEEIKEKIKSGEWTEADVKLIIADLQESSDLAAHISEIYFTSYGVFVYNYRECVHPMIAICQEAKLLLGPSKEKSLIYLALVRLYFCMGFLPKVVEYSLKYAGSGYTLRDNLKSVYNTLVAAFTDCGLYKEADIYLEKMMDISRLDPCGPDKDFWSSDVMNEFVYYDSKVYVMLGMGRRREAEQASWDSGRLLMQEGIPEEGRSFFRLQKECTDMYLRMYQSEDSPEIAEEFNGYMRRMESGEIKVDSLNFCIRYFAELLQVMVKEERWEDIIRIGNFIRSGRNFSGSICPVYKVMCQAAHRSEKEEIRSQAPEFERMYLKAMEQEKESYDEMLRLLAKEELRIVNLKEAMNKDSLTGCLSRAAFDRDSKRFIRDHKEGCLVFLDLDYLKEINDSYGHENGDRYLVCFARNMKRALGMDGALYRYAGDEFLILSSGKKEEIQKRLQQILEEKPILFGIKGQKRHISFSYGAVAFEEKYGEIAELVKEADNRMYLCKGKNHQRISERGEH